MQNSFPRGLWWVAVLLAAHGCVARSSLLVGVEDPVSLVSLVLLVEPTYPVHGANWNDYVANDWEAGSATDAPCDDRAADYRACVHGGELRRVVVPGVSSCIGLDLTDALGVFEWHCELQSGVATFFSTGFETGRGLRDLVAADRWLDNAVHLTGAARGESSPEVWWTNPVIPLPNNTTSTGAMVLDGVDDGGEDSVFGSGTLLTLAESRLTPGYNLNTDRLALVTLPGATMTFASGAAENHDPATGEASGNQIERCIVGAGSHSFMWIEAELDGDGMEGTGLCLSGLRFSRVHRTSVERTHDTNNWGGGVVLTAVESSVFTWLTVDRVSKGVRAESYHTFYDGLWLSNQDDVFWAAFTLDGTGNHLNRVVAANNSRTGLQIQDNGNRLSGIVAYNNGSTGLLVNAQTQLINVVTAHNRGSGLILSDDFGSASGSSAVNLVSAYNGDIGVHTLTGPLAFSNLVLVGNVGDGMFAESNGDATLSNVVVSDSAGVDVSLRGGSHRFQGQLLVTDQTSCSTGVGRGLSDGDCAPETGSPATLSWVGSVAADFVGAVGVDDPMNSADGSLGSASYPGSAAFDWFEFSRPERIWGIWQAPGPWTDGFGFVLDFGLSHTATKLLATTTDSPELFSANGRCPMAVDSNDPNMVGVSELGDPYLRNAFEIVDPSSSGYSIRGDHDGFCEAAESCLYTPNLGVYQGHGALERCESMPGPIDAVIYGYTWNGW